ncbi:MAG: hypothetical protein C4576_27435 [Desulfobacteraceae bacterium]|nr:MAG: hypothetical protein C4576_27435 [Desulfobacteraceae bacterium]
MSSAGPAADGEQSQRVSGRDKKRNHAERRFFSIIPHQIRDSLSGEFSPARVIPQEEKVLEVFPNGQKRWRVSVFRFRTRCLPVPDAQLD